MCSGGDQIGKPLDNSCIEIVSKVNRRNFRIVIILRVVKGGEMLISLNYAGV